MIGQAKSLSLSLKVPQTRKQESGPIRFALSQINSQRGSFRHVTEESLKAEITASDLSNRENGLEDGDQNNGEDAVEDRDEKARRARDEMLRLSAIARIEAFSALEFLSFLLSKYNPVQAKTSLSKESQEKFKQLGTMEARSVSRKEAPVETKRTVENVSRGYKMDAFYSCSENLLHASRRLHKDADAETRYWEGLMSLKAKGWAVSRLPGRKDIWAVHFASAESRPMFRDRGIATLNKAADGNLWLDFGSSPLAPKSIKIDIVDRNARTISTSRLRTTSTADTDNDLQRQVSQARNTLFEEELFLEINREATALASYNVKARLGIVVCPLGRDYEACISLVDLDEASHTESETDDPQIAVEFDANRVALVLRLLLSHAHHQNLKRRSQPPPPMMTLRPRSTPEYHLIRPILAYYEHKEILGRISTLLSNLASPCKIAGIPFSFNGSFLDHINLLKISPSTSAADNWLSSLISEPFTTTISFNLPSSQRLDIGIRTQAAAPTFGTEFTITSSLPQYSFFPANRGVPRISNFQELETFLIQFLSRDVLAWLQLHSHLESLSTRQTQSSLIDQKADKDTMDVDAASSSSPSIAASVPLKWEILDAVDMWLTSNPPGVHLGLQIQPERIQCQLHTQEGNSLEPESKSQQVYQWSSAISCDGDRVVALEKLGRAERAEVQMKTLPEIVAEVVGETH